MSFKMDKIDGKVNIYGLTEDQIYFIAEKSFKSIVAWHEGENMVEVHPMFDFLRDLVEVIRVDRNIGFISQVIEFYDTYGKKIPDQEGRDIR